MDDRGLKYFEAVVRLGGIRGASELLHVSPSAISRQIKLLESQLKVRLLERIGRGVGVTSAGERLMDHIKSVHRLEDDFRALLCDMEGLRVGTIRIATGGGFISDLITGAIASFSKTYPGLRYVIHVVGGDEVVRRVRDDDVDLGLTMNCPSNPQIEILKSCPCQPLSLIVHPKDALAKRRQFSFLELQSQRLALLNDSFNVSQLLRRSEVEYGIRLQPVLESDSFESLKLFVLAGLGATVLPAFCVSKELREGSLKLVPLKQSRKTNTSVDLIIRRGREHTARILAIASHIEKHMAAWNTRG